MMDRDTRSSRRTQAHPRETSLFSDSMVQVVRRRMSSFIQTCLFNVGHYLHSHLYHTIKNEVFVAASLRLLLMASISCLGYLSVVMTDSLHAQERETVEATRHGPSDAPATMEHATNESCSLPEGMTFENLQIETADIRLHEQLFESVLHATPMQRLDHPQTDRIRAYCYRDILIVIRQDLRTPRPTGWVQVNFMVNDVAALQQELEATARTAFGTLDLKERDKIVRFRSKPGVMRNHRKVDRLEVYGPEGFLIGFDQVQH